METLDHSQRNRNATIAIAGLSLALACTLLWSQLAYDCEYGACDSPRFAVMPLLLLAGAAAGWLAGAIFGLNALWGKPVSRDRLTWPASAGVVMFVCVTLQTAVWAS
jgi:hypothetical protein